ncbi:extracellular solute-binding protein [Spirochaeta isovalerica]|uniref:Putative aldouronate transport system substrate-binding protein n=1 Tax=Spirochaeta isovalerica TaxID=150 RepID=A0A841RBG3_9SPIO|nr:extracellular solute-binding protein [Spirochaeta isovalerica]MBB6480018.1 putative aldouronate transport system substrate-binding protein [Spirochaeta isovalerica]
MKKSLIPLLMVMTIGSAFAAGNQEAAVSSGGTVDLDVWAVKAAELQVDTESLANWKGIEEATGTSLNWQLISTEVKDEQFNLIMTSGNLPDVMAYYEGKSGFSSVNKFGTQGAFLPLEDLIREHAPNLKAAILDDPKVRESLMASDGNIYYIPMLSALNAARGWFIRYDWLEAVGKDVPTTTDELYEVLLAFKNEDPNGNGEADEIPMIFRRRGDDAFYNLGALAYAFDADTGWVLRNGKVVYGPSEPQYLDFLKYIAKLYKEKLIDQEILTRPGNPRNDLLGKDQAGAIHDWFASTASLNDTLASDIPGFNLRHMAPPVGTADRPFTRIQMSKVRGDGGWSISHSNPDPIATIKMMDYIFSPEGSRYVNFGVENDTYVLEGGKPLYTDKITKNPDMGFHEALVTNGMQWKIGLQQDIEYEKQFANAIATAARIDYMDNFIEEEFPILSFTEDEQMVIDDKLSQINLYTAEMSSRALIGADKTADLTKIFAELNNMGLKEVTAIYQAAYDRKK